MDNKKQGSSSRIAGVVPLIIGIVIDVIAWITIYDDMHRDSFFDIYYTYTPPFTGHEIFMIALVVLATCLEIIGVVKIWKAKNGSNSSKD